MAPILYMSTLSPPSRAVQITAKTLCLELEIRNLDLTKQENRSPEYLKINPLHSVPTLDDEGVIITDSHAINAYLIRKYSLEDNSLYPQDYAKRALVDQRLHFDSAIFFNLFRHSVAPIFYRKSKEIPEEQKGKIREAYMFLETFLEKTEWIAGDEITIADFSIGSTFAALELLVPLDPENFPKITNWIQKFRDLEHTSILELAIKELKTILDKLMS